MWRGLILIQIGLLVDLLVGEKLQAQAVSSAALEGSSEEALSHPSPAVRMDAVKVLCQTPDGTGCQAGVLVLGALLSDDDAAVRKEALNLLGALGMSAEPAVQRLEVALHKGLLGVEAIKVLTRIGTPRAIAGIAAAVTYRDPKVRKAAIAALGELGNKAQGEVEVLVRAMQERDMAEPVLEALAKIGSPRALSAVIEPLRGTDKGLKLKAIQILGGMGAQAEAALPALVRASGDGDADIRRAADEALAAIRSVPLLDPDDFQAD